MAKISYEYLLVSWNLFGLVREYSIADGDDSEGEFSVIASGLRGFVFSITLTNLIQRLRDVLFAAIVKQDIEFFDQTKTGEITSRLSSDITTVGEAVSINLNVFLRSIVQIGKSIHRLIDMNTMNLIDSGNDCHDGDFIMEFVCSGIDYGTIGIWYCENLWRSDGGRWKNV